MRGRHGIMLSIACVLGAPAPAGAEDATFTEGAGAAPNAPK